MFAKRSQSGFTLMEVLVVVSVVLILAGSLVGIGKYMTVRARTQLCESQVEVICTALEQYYTDYDAFPFVTDVDGDGDSFDDATGLPDYQVADLLTDLDGSAVSAGTFDDLNEAAPSSTALYYFLDKAPNSRKIIQALTGDLVTSQDAGGVNIQVSLAGGETVDLPRFVDPWGQSLRYEYLDGAAFPIVTSAGPDGDFDTADDNVTSQ